MSFMEQLKDGLSKTRKNFTERMEDLVGASVDLDEDFMDEMEMILVAGDVGIKTTEKIMAALRKAAATRQIKSPAEALPFLKSYIADLLKTTGPRMRFKGHPSIVLVVGVNGVGKTTTIGKLSRGHLPGRSHGTAPDLGQKSPGGRDRSRGRGGSGGSGL